MGRAAFLSGGVVGRSGNERSAVGGLVCQRRTVVVSMADTPPKRRGRPRKDKTPKEDSDVSNSDVLNMFLAKFDDDADETAGQRTSTELDDLDFYASQAKRGAAGDEEDDDVDLEVDEEDPDLGFGQAEIVDDDGPEDQAVKTGNDVSLAVTGEESTDFLLDLDMNESSDRELEASGDAADADESNDPFEDQVPDSHRERVKSASLFGFLDEDDEEETEEDDEGDTEPEQDEDDDIPSPPRKNALSTSDLKKAPDSTKDEMPNPLDSIFGDEEEFASVRSSVLRSQIEPPSSPAASGRRVNRKAMVSDLLDVGTERTPSASDKSDRTPAKSNKKLSLVDLQTIDDNIDYDEEEEDEAEPVTLDDYDEADEEAFIDSRLSKLSERNMGRVIFYNDDNHVSVTNRNNFSLDDEGEQEADSFAIQDGELLPELASSNVPRSSKEWLGRRLFELSLKSGYQQLDAWSKRRTAAPSTMESLFPPEPPAPPKLERITVSSEQDAEKEDLENVDSSVDEQDEIRDFFRSKSNLATESDSNMGDKVSFPCVYSFKAVGLGDECASELQADIEKVLGQSLDSNALFVEQSGKYTLVEVAALVHSPRDVTQVYDAIRENPSVKFSYG